MDLAFFACCGFFAFAFGFASASSAAPLAAGAPLAPDPDGANALSHLAHRAARPAQHATREALGPRTEAGRQRRRSAPERRGGLGDEREAEVPEAALEEEKNNG